MCEKKGGRAFAAVLGNILLFGLKDNHMAVWDFNLLLYETPAAVSKLWHIDIKSKTNIAITTFCFLSFTLLLKEYVTSGGVCIV